MSKNTQNTKKDGRGRPEKPLVLPNGSRFTVTEVLDANKDNIKCRLTIYNRLKKLVKANVIRKTKETVPTGGVGKPGSVYVTVASLARSKAAKKAAKTRKLAKLAPVEMKTEEKPVNEPVAA